MKKILIGTHNRGKFKEISDLLSKKVKKISPITLKIKSPKETGKTFKENSEIKAKYFCKKSKIISISDDSGLCVDSLNGKPGIYSARWGKRYGGFHNAMKKIISLVKKKSSKHETSKAKFVCSLTLMYPNGKKLTSIGQINGSISNKILGKNGFGYDAIFIPKGNKLTFGQMSKKKKYLIDHRYKAFKKLKQKVKIL